ncbi:secondary thiamine-phosphate synthase enzyme YjbQ [Rhabdochromatium marinum]|uniref:secondary thiamine-phosphate synthase enzyme YjbQ n=1 Tax=Rhabdochromatium marinum TaxID=48729 RepID=UPI00190610D4|nr:secondary thiamine-phosphate synthase enzyme YjbQ [Rhabdochromatium marinum]MBK1650433.1 secondary thiamine-phosphate synthase enzyme [Rhabdochromatium marinum]
MKMILDEITLPTRQPIEIIDMTQQLRERCTQSGIRSGVATLISQHTTAYVNLNEREARLQQDMLTFLKRFIPRDGDYAHNIAPVDDRDNAHAHLLGLFMNASESIPISDGQLMLGDWQSVFFIELDGPRASRTLTLQFLGDS